MRPHPSSPNSALLDHLLWRTSAVARRAAACAAVTLAVGCATAPAPVEQVRYFSQAFAAVNTVGQPMLDDLAASERALGRRNAVVRARASKECASGSGEAPWALSADTKLGYIEGFCLDDAGYFASVGDPPATAQMRGALRLIERYADLLGALVEGRNVDQAVGEATALAQHTEGLLQLAGANVAIGAAVQALKPLLADVARQSDALAARQLILDGAPKVTQLIGALRAAVPATFNTLTAELRRQAGTPAGAAAAVSGIEARRAAVADYVVLLDKLEGAWDATVAAARNPQGTKLPDLVARTAQLRADADAARRALVTLRTGVAP
jgi:hypothetical protein